MPGLMILINCCKDMPTAEAGKAGSSTSYSLGLGQQPSQRALPGLAIYAYVTHPCSRKRESPPVQRESFARRHRETREVVVSGLLIQTTLITEKTQRRRMAPGVAENPTPLHLQQGSPNPPHLQKPIFFLLLINHFLLNPSMTQIF